MARTRRIGMCASPEAESGSALWYGGCRVAGGNFIGIVVPRSVGGRDRAAQQGIVGGLHPRIHPPPQFAKRRAAGRIVCQIVSLVGIEDEVV